MQNTPKEIAEKAKKMAMEDYDLIANIINQTSSKQKYIKSRTEHYINKFMKRK